MTDFNIIFKDIRNKLDAHYDRRERLVKVSRDVTALSKKMIFCLQRVKDEDGIPEGILREVGTREKEIEMLLEKMEKEIAGTDGYRCSFVQCCINNFRY